MKHKDHYSKDYFEWQKKIGNKNVKNVFYKFKDYINKEQVIVEFGSGGGYLLNYIKCKEKVGIEINETAREASSKLGIKTLPSINSLNENFADLIISHHVLEHTTHPLNELKGLFKILKPNGKIVFVTPHESITRSYKPNDINYHLYTWSPMNLGNLFIEAGFNVIESKALYGRKFSFLSKSIWLFLNRIYRKGITQVRIVGEKK